MHGDTWTAMKVTARAGAYRRGAAPLDELTARADLADQSVAKRFNGVKLPLSRKSSLWREICRAHSRLPPLYFC